MASFPTHFSFGIALGVIGAMLAVGLSLVSEPAFVITLFLAAALGAILPDMDSDSSVPFHVSFGSLAFVAAALSFFSVWKESPDDIQALIIFPVGTAFIVWVIIGAIFKRFTKHRGIVHSIPATLLSGLTTFFVASHFGFSDTESFLLGLSMMLGFLGHLVLDEIWAAVNFQGKLFVPNKALGSALKLYSGDTVANLVVFGAVLFLLAGNVGLFYSLIETFLQSIK